MTRQVARTAPDDESYEEQAYHYRQQQEETNSAQFAECVIVVQDIDKHPVGLSANGGIENMFLVAMFVLRREVAFLVAIGFQYLDCLPEHRAVLTSQQIVAACRKKTLG